MTIKDSNPAEVGTVTEKAAPKSPAEFFSNEEEDSEATTSDHASEEDGDSAVEQADESEEQDAEKAEGEEDQEAEESEEDEAKKDDDEPSKSVDEVKIDGKNYTLEEVKHGFMHQADYTRKTQQLASDRKEFNAAIERLGEQDTVARQTIELAQSIIQAAVPPEPNIDTLDADPVGFQKALYVREQALRLIRELHSKNAQIEQQASGRRAEVTQEQLDNELAIAFEKIPALRTKDGKTKFRNEAIEYGEKHWGLEAVEIDSIKSSKELAVLADAIAYRKLMAAKPKAVEKVKQAPKIAIAKPGTRGNRPETIMSKLQKLGRKATAADHFAAMEED